jgi:hypothetical protein
MSEESNVTVIFMVPQRGGAYEAKEFHNVTVNSRAPVKKLIPALLETFPEANFGEDEADLLIQAPDGSSLSNVTIQDGSRLVIFPKYGSGPLVKR